MGDSIGDDALLEVSCTAERKMSRDGRRTALANERSVSCDERCLC